MPSYGDVDDGDEFRLQGSVGAGELVDVPEWDDGWMGFREEGAWVRARPDSEFGDGEGWRVEAPDGTTYFFGVSEDTREGPGPDSFDETYCWTLTKKENTWGHSVSYNYQRQDGRLYLSNIRYAEDTPSPRVIRFSYEQRPDVLGNWKAGYKRSFAQRLSSIEAIVESSQQTGGERVLATMSLSYEAHWNTSRIVSIGLTGEDGETLPTQSFTYEDFAPEAAESLTLDAPTIPANRPGYRFFDVNGDSFPDLVRGTTTGWEYYRNENGQSLDREPRAITNPPSFDATTADWTVADIDGDGLRDILFRPSEASQIRAYRNVSPMDGETAEFEYIGEIGTSTPVPLNDPSLRLVDLNLDRRIDFLLSPGNGQLSASLSTVIRDDDGVVRSSSEVTWDGFQGVAERVDGVAPSGIEGLPTIDLAKDGVQLAEMNGDGLDDLVRVFGGAGQVTSIRVHPSRGQGAFSEGYRINGLPSGIEDADPADIRIVDINTDGLGDILVLGTASVRYWLNQGGTSLSQEYEQALPGAGASAFRSLTDANGNGTVDIVIVDPAAESWSVVDPIGEQPVGLLRSADNGMGGNYAMDYRSLAVVSTDSAEAGFPWESYIPQPMTVVTESRISDSRGYEGVSKRTYRNPAWSIDEGAFRGFEGASVELVGDDRAPSRVTDYVFYTGVGKEAQDFGTALGQPQKYFPQSDLKILSGRARSVTQRTTDGQVFSQTLSAYDVLDLSGGRRRAVKTDTLTITPERARLAPPIGYTFGTWGGWTATPRTAEDGEQARWRTRTSMEHDEYGHTIRTTNWGYVDASGQNIPGDETVAEQDVLHQREPWRIGVPYETRTLSLDGELLARSRTYFDGPAFEGLPLGEVTRGATTRQTQWLAEEDRWIDVVRNQYDDDGNVTAVKDALGHLVEIEYDDTIRALPTREVMRLDTGVYADHTTDGAPNALETSAEYDLDRGLATSVTDFNGQTTRVRYDGLGRMTKMIAPGDSEELPTVRYEYSFGSPVSSLDVYQRERSGESGTIDTRSYVDGLGREVATLKESSNGQYTVTGQTAYANTGDPYIEYHPYEVSSFSLPAGAPPASVPSRDIFYDAAGRVRRTTLEDGSFTRIQFRPGRTISFDPNDVDPTSPHEGTPSITEIDGLGRTVSTRLTLADGASRDYRSEWDPRGLLVSKTLPDGSSRSWTYDSLGRRTSVTDPNAGTQYRAYDDLGHVVRQDNATGQQVISRHDPLGRLWEVGLKDDFESGEDVIARYRYDVATDEKFPANHSLGRLTYRDESAFDTYLDYDRRGRLSRVFRTLDEKVYQSGTRYDAADRSTHQIYSDGSVLASEYDAQGRIAALPSIVDGVEYNEDGTVAGVSYGNGVQRSHAYDERLRMVRYQLDSPSEGMLFDVGMAYDRAGVPTAVTDNVMNSGPLSQSRSWSYDALYRPSQMQAASIGTISYTFNEANSLVDRRLSGDPTAGATRVEDVSVGTYELGGDAPEGLVAGPHHVTRANNRQLGYNPNGQLVVDRREATEDSLGGDRQLYWDAAGRLTEVELVDGRRVTHSYNGSFDRMERRLYDLDASIGERTVYLSPIEELRWRGGTFEYRKTAKLAGERVADVRSEDNPGVPIDEFLAESEAPWTAAGWTPPDSRGGPADVKPAPSGPSHLPLWALSVALALLLLCLRRLSFAQTHRAAARARLDAVQTWQGLSSLQPVTDTALRALSSKWKGTHIDRASNRSFLFPGERHSWKLCASRNREQEIDGQGGANPGPSVLRRAVALLLAGALTVVGLPGCGGGGPSNQVNEDEQWEPSVSFIGVEDDVVFYHAPMLGTPAIQTDETGAVHNRQSSTPYGIRTGHEGSSSDEFKFTGKEWDDDLDLVYFGARYYDPELGTWLSVDPLVLWGDDGSLSPFDQNPLAYVGGRVTLAVDEFGFEGFFDSAKSFGSNVAGRFAETAGRALNSEAGIRIVGGVTAAGGVAEMAVGITLIGAPEPTTATKFAGAAFAVHGADTFKAGLEQALTGRRTETATKQLATSTARSVGASESTAESFGNAVDLSIGLMSAVAPTGPLSGLRMADDVTSGGSALVDDFLTGLVPRETDKATQYSIAGDFDDALEQFNRMVDPDSIQSPRPGVSYGRVKDDPSTFITVRRPEESNYGAATLDFNSESGARTVKVRFEQEVVE
jgi:RHS repeat-associated protein